MKILRKLHSLKKKELKNMCGIITDNKQQINGITYTDVEKVKNSSRTGFKGDYIFMSWIVKPVGSKIEKYLNVEYKEDHYCLRVVISDLFDISFYDEGFQDSKIIRPMNIFEYVKYLIDIKVVEL